MPRHFETEFVQERFSPRRFMVPWVRDQHVARYDWAVRYTKGKKVLDVACGVGYGCQILRNAGAVLVVGVDVSREALREAYADWRADRVLLLQGDAQQLPFPSAGYDLVSSFETIEHLPDDRRFLGEVQRVLRPGGVFLCSTPNRNLLSPGRTQAERPSNRHHMREYSIEEYRTLLSDYFSVAEVLGQANYARPYEELLTRIGKWLPGVACRVHQARKALEWPLVRRSRATPQPMKAGYSPEMMIAVCRRV
jgi:ubiquinone/menaquinone biosynthesis C-methylase UbiE